MFRRKYHILPAGLTYYRNGRLDAPKRSEHVSAESVLTMGEYQFRSAGGNSQNESRMWWQALSFEPVSCAPMPHQPATGSQLRVR